MYIITLAQIYEWINMKFVINTQKYKHTDEVIVDIQDEKTKKNIEAYEIKLKCTFYLFSGIYTVYQVLVIFDIIATYGSLDYYLQILFCSQLIFGLFYSFLLLQRLLKMYHNKQYAEIKASLIFFFYIETLGQLLLLSIYATGLFY